MELGPNMIKGDTLGCNHCIIFITISGYLNYFLKIKLTYTTIFLNILWKHLTKLEMNMEYPKALLKQCSPWFSLFNGIFLKIKLI